MPNIANCRQGLLLFGMSLMMGACGSGDSGVGDDAAGTLEPFEYQGLMGYRDSATRKTVIQPRFTTAYPFRGDHARVRAKSGYGIIRRDGTFSVMPTYTRLTRIRGGLVPAYKDGAWGVLTTSGKTVLPFEHQAIGDIRQGRIPAKANGFWGIADTAGRYLVRPSFQSIRPFHCGIARAKIGNYWGLLGRDGRIIVRPLFRYIDPFHHGLARVRVFARDIAISPDPCASLKVRYGFIDRTGKLVIPPIFERAGHFNARHRATLLLPWADRDYPIVADTAGGVVTGELPAALDPNRPLAPQFKVEFRNKELPHLPEPRQPQPSATPGRRPDAEVS